MASVAPHSPRSAVPKNGAASRPLTLIDEYLARQREPTAVERFANRHAAGTVATPAQQRYYQDLIPLSTPGPGQQYAFEVDLDACTGCKACVTACHNLNGLDETETWRAVGLLAGGTRELPVLQHVTSACHHCIDPACMNGCPVKAYEKDPITGIVRHLDDQCIGCQYCTLTCPYDVPKYNKSKGIVRKCDMCSGRLAVGEAPACVQACPNEAIRIRIIAQHQVIAASEVCGFLPGVADPRYTLPTTAYKQRRPLPRNTLPVDYYKVHPEHAHWPLVVMLVLTQLSVGAFAVGQAFDRVASTGALAATRPFRSAVALGLGMLALGASVLHLGRPVYAFRAVIGLRTSWLSREIVVFGLFAGLASAYAGALLLPNAAPSWLLPPLGDAVVATGLLGIICSVMIYHGTRREFWHWRHTAPKFVLSALLLGLSTTLFTAAIGPTTAARLEIHPMLDGGGILACRLLALLTFLKLVYGALIFRHLRDRHHTAIKRTARLLVAPLLNVVLARYAAGLVGGVLLPLLATTGTGGTELRILLAASFLLLLVGELLERYLFFTTVVAPKMPGGL